MNNLRINGAPVHKAGPWGRIRKLAVTIGAIGLIAMSSAVIAQSGGPEGTISGFVFNISVKKTKAVAIAADGTRHEVTVRRSGHYRISNLPPGSYKLEFSQGDTMWFDDVVVEGAKEVVVNTTNPKAK